MDDEFRMVRARLAGHIEIGSCPRCGEPVRWKGRGRKPRWCSQTCRVRAKEARRAARDNERPLSVVDGPRRPNSVEQWARVLSDPQHDRTLVRVLRRVVDTRGRPEFVPDEADELVEAMFRLPAGSGARLRKGLPLPDADERREAQRVQQERLSALERDRSRVAEVESAAYTRGRAHGYADGRDDARREFARKQRTHTPSTQPVGMSRQQRRAAERAAAKQRRKQATTSSVEGEQTLPGMD